MDKFVIEKELGHNLSDRAELFNGKEAYEKFSSMDGIRRIGLSSGGQDIFLLKADGSKMPELLELKESDARYLERLRGIREQWLVQSAFSYRQKCSHEMKKLLEQASAPTARRQAKMDFKKEIQKRMQTSKKVFLNHRMEGFDFRQINLESAIFINCSLNGSNFSHVNLQDAVFVNCRLEDVVWYGAFTNNAFVYQSDWVTELKEIQEEGNGQI